MVRNPDIPEQHALISTKIHISHESKHAFFQPKICAFCICLYMGVSKNSVFPPNHPLKNRVIMFTIHFGGFTPIFGNTHISTCRWYEFPWDFPMTKPSSSMMPTSAKVNVEVCCLFFSGSIVIDVSHDVYIKKIYIHVLNKASFFCHNQKTKKVIDYTYLLPLMLFRSLGPHLQHIKRKAVSCWTSLLHFSILWAKYGVWQPPYYWVMMVPLAKHWDFRSFFASKAFSLKYSTALGSKWMSLAAPRGRLMRFQWYITPLQLQVLASEATFMKVLYEPNEIPWPREPQHKTRFILQ